MRHQYHKKQKRRKTKTKTRKGSFGGTFFLGISFFVLVGLAGYSFFSTTISFSSEEVLVKGEEAFENMENTENMKDKLPIEEPEPELDKKEYDRRVLALANRPEPEVSTSTASTTGSTTAATTTPEENYLWPTEAPYPEVGAILPFHRIVAFYGNFYSKRMGVLGEYSEEVVLEKLRARVKEWEEADPDTPVVPAIDYIAITAQGAPQADGSYNLHMPDEHIERAISMAKKVDGIVILEVQAGQANLQKEIEGLEKYLKKPEVHLAIDPEFNMKRGNAPGAMIGTVDDGDVNRAAEYLKRLAKENDLPPKILIVHRFTQKMVQNAEAIKPNSHVQVVMVMDGWGARYLKESTYRRVIYPEPVQFTGFKIFFKNDLKPPSTGLMTPDEMLDLRPKPIFIQYQ